MSPEFRLLPWERGGHPIAPSVEMSAQVEGRLRRFQVKQHKERLYFRFADEDEKESRVWTLLEYNVPLCEESFRQEIEANRVVRFLLVQRGVAISGEIEAFAVGHNGRSYKFNPPLMGPTCLGVVVSEAGRAWAQEWSGGSWVGFDLESRLPKSGAWRPSIWSRNWNAIALKKAMRQLTLPLAFRPFTPPPSEPLRFLQGSLEELETLLRAASVHFVVNNKEYHAYRSYSRTVHISLALRAETQQSALYQAHNHLSIIPHRIVQIFLAHNTPIGGEWQRRDWSAYHAQGSTQNPLPPADFNRRLDFNFAPYQLEIKTQGFFEPTAHEQLEAQRTLRQWLEENGYGGQIKQLLML